MPAEIIRQTLIGRPVEEVFTWKGFKFPVSIEEFSIQEPAKVATYEYAGRNGAEHERVLNYRIFTIKGCFCESSGNRTPLYYIQKLRFLNDNKPGVFLHKDFGEFTCIMKSLQISQSGKGAEIDSGGTVKETYEFSIELWEHTDPSSPSISDSLSKLFPAAVVKPPSDNYSTRLQYTTQRRLFLAIKNGKIEPGTDPIRHAEWLQYPIELRTAAFSQWETYLTTGVNPYAEVEITTAKQKVHVVKPGETPLQMCMANNVSINDTYQANRGRKVREEYVPEFNSSGPWTPDLSYSSAEGYYWKNPMKIYPGDKILIPQTPALDYTPAYFTPAN